MRELDYASGPEEALFGVLPHLLRHTPLILRLVLHRLRQSNRLNPSNSGNSA
jgi:hypothetical protein